MSCTVITDKNNEAVAIVCASSWGIGVYKTDEPEGSEFEYIYGFPSSNLDPHDFDPDYECCTDEEIAAWEKAKQECLNHKEN